MSLLETIEKARRLIQSGSLQNEQQVILAIIMPVLRDLGWDTAEPEQVVPEFTIGTGRVDYALLGTNGTPLVLIEAKAHHKIRESSIDQLFRYAYGAGAGIIVLTDGQKWQLYLAQKTGVVAGDRLFCHLDLSNTSTETCEKALGRYLGRDNVLEHKAFRYANVDFDERVQVAEKEKQEKQERDKLRTLLPNIWEELKQDRTSPLYELMSRAIANAGLKGYPEVLAEFISRLGPGQGPSTQSSYVADKPPNPPLGVADSSSHPPRKSWIGYTLFGQRKNTNSGVDTLVEVFNEFIKNDLHFVSKLRSSQPGWWSGSINFIADKPEDVFITRPDSKPSPKRLINGQYINIKLGFVAIEDRIKRAAEVLKIQYGVDLVLHDAHDSPSPRESYTARESTADQTEYRRGGGNPRRSLAGYTLNGERYYARSTAETLRMIFSKFIELDPRFESKLRSRRPGWFSNNRQFIAESPEALFQSITKYQSVYRQSSSKELDNGRYISTHMGFEEAKKRIEVGCEIVGIRYGTDLILHEQ